MKELIGERCILIIKSLISKDILTLKDLKYICNVSERTISKDLDIVENFVEQYGLTLIRKPKMGIWIEGAKANKEKLFMEVNVNSPQTLGSPKERQDYILLRLLLSSGYMTMQDLYDEIYVSRGTLENDLEKLESNINKEGLSLERISSRGIRIAGDEKKLRILIADFFLKIAYVMPSREFIKYANLKEEGVSYEQVMENKLFDMFSGLDLKAIEKLISEAEEKLGYKFSDMAFTSLLINLAIAVIRIKSDCNICIGEEDIRNLETTREFEVASSMAASMGKLFDIRVSHEECAYVAIHILCSEIHYNLLNKDEDSLRGIKLKNSIENLCIDMIGRASCALDIDFNRDIILLKGLSIHTQVALNRLLYGMPIKNPMLDGIKASYITSFQAAVAASEVIKERCGLEVDENEIAYIALHFEAALERIRNNIIVKKKVLLVCSLGIGTSQLIASKLKRIFDNIEIIDIISSNVAGSYNMAGIDLIITTIPLAVESVTTIRVNPVLSQGDIENIRKFALSSRPLKDNKKNNSGEELDLIDRELILINRDFSTREEIIKSITDLMLQKGYVGEGYYNSVLEREKIASTSSGRVALPHGDISKVYKSVIAICTLDKKVDWENSQVELVIMLAIKKEDVLKIQNIFDIIYDSISDNKTVSKITSCTEADNILELLLG